MVIVVAKFEDNIFQLDNEHFQLELNLSIINKINGITARCLQFLHNNQT